MLLDFVENLGEDFVQRTLQNPRVAMLMQRCATLRSVVSTTSHAVKVTSLQRGVVRWYDRACIVAPLEYSQAQQADSIERWKRLAACAEQDKLEV